MTETNSHKKECIITDKIELNETAEPQAEEISEKTENADTTEQNEVTVPVKFNKEIRNLSLTEAGELAQMGLKYRSIEKEYNQLRQMAMEDKKSVPDFISDINKNRLEEKKRELTEKCGGDSEFAEHIIKLEKTHENEDFGLEEIKEYFPEIKNTDDLPEAVTDNAKLKGTRLLDEYLRFLLNEKKDRESAIKMQETAEKSSTGSQINRNRGANPEAEEFLRGLWK